MITDVREERLLVTSDSHIGSFFCDARRGLLRFIEYAGSNGFNVCINGDGIDVQHTSLRRMAAEASAFLGELRRLTERHGVTVYYTIGNHDIILEHYVGDWGGLRLVPFLNVRSGAKRIRIEHGHLYDPFLMKHPDLQDALTRFGGLICRVYPPWYHWHKIYKVVKYRYTRTLFGRQRDAEVSPLTDDSPTFFDAAEELARRGFDAVIFGHTHRPGTVPLNGSRAMYYNTGSWFGQPHYITITGGDVELKPWVQR